MSYHVGIEKTVYIRIPKDTSKKTIEIPLSVPADKDVYLKVDLLDKSTARDIPVNCNCSPSHCNTCQVHYCNVNQGNADLYELPSPVKSEPAPKSTDDDTIPGHPNCKRGDCRDCHVVSCAIYQGYEEEP